MNPDNNALSRTYFIGGPPRVGKSILAYKLARKRAGHVVSTDAIRGAAKKVNQDKGGDLFRINQYNELTETEWLERHNNYPDIVVADQNKESEAFWSSIVSFCNTFCEDNEKHIVEGVALLPRSVAEMKHQPEHVVFIGNTSDDHGKILLEHSKEFPEQDWLAAMGYSEARMVAMANFIKHMSLYFKREAATYGYPYFEINDRGFDANLNQIVTTILNTGS